MALVFESQDSSTVYPHFGVTKKHAYFPREPQWFISMDQRSLLDAAKHAVDGV